MWKGYRRNRSSNRSYHTQSNQICILNSPPTRNMIHSLRSVPVLLPPYVKLPSTLLITPAPWWAENLKNQAIQWGRNGAELLFAK